MPIFLGLLLMLATILWSQICGELGIELISIHTIFGISTIVAILSLTICALGSWIEEADDALGKIGVLPHRALEKTRLASTRTLQSFKPPTPTSTLAS
jgi:hypothetical protein